MGKNKYVLAMYDVRGKQDFIFRSSHIKEIIGGSALISDIFEDYLYPAAREYRNRKYDWDDKGQAEKPGCRMVAAPEDEKAAEASAKGEAEAILRPDEPFTRESFMRSMEDSRYVGQVVYDGGGNFFILYRDLETYVEINKLFSKRVLEAIGTLKVISAHIEGVDFDHFQEDRRKLYAIHRGIEAVEAPSFPAQVFPFTQVDYSSSMPLYGIKYIAGEKKKLTKESLRKYEKFEERLRKPGSGDAFDEAVLDNLVTEKGRESLLAIIYIDGNNMGAKVKDCLRGKSSYEECVRELRDFSGKIQANFVDDRKKAIDQALAERYPGDPNRQKRRFIVQAGDEINFICNARDAYAIMKAYFKDMPEPYSACAGISIFHSHAPYADAYRIAEECCESGKQKMKALELKEANLVDVQYCQAGIGIDLETIRAREAGELISKPWYVRPYDVPQDENYFTLDMVEAMAAELNKMARSNVKELSEYARQGLTKLNMELKRIAAHTGKENRADLHLCDAQGKPLLDDKKMQKLVYDVVILYDLWFDKGGEETDE